MKKRKLLLEILFIIAISLIFSACLFSNRIYSDAHDLTFHLNRIVGLADAFDEGQLLPKIYPYSNNGFGYASPLFYCDLFLYPFALVYKSGVPLIITYKLMLICLSLGTTAIAFFCSKKVFKKEATSYACTLLYVFSSYHFYDVYVRSAIGEAYGIMFTPLVIYSIYKILVLKKNDYILLTISFSCLVMNHLISALLFGVVFAMSIVLYTIVNWKDKKLIINTFCCIFKGTVIALLLCAWFLLPMFEQLRVQPYYLNTVDQVFDAKSSILSISSIFYPFAKLDGNGLVISDIISVGLILLVLPIFYFFVKKSKLINYCFVWIGICFLLILGVLPLPNCLTMIQFLFRLYIIIYPLLTIVCAYILDVIESKKIIYGLMLVICLYSIINTFGISKEMNEIPKYYINAEIAETIFDNSDISLDYNNKQLGGGEYLPICNNEDYINDNKNICVYYDDGREEITISDYDRSYSKISFNIDSDADYATLPLTYYKGYIAYCDGEPIDCIKDEVFCKLGILLQDGNHKYAVKYIGTKIQKYSLLLSACSFVLLMVNIVYNEYVNRNGEIWQRRIVKKKR